MRRSLLLLALAAAICCIACLSPVTAAGHSGLAKKTPLPADHTPTSFPTKAQLKSNRRLAERFTEQNKINVHVVCHTHDDVGWLKTVDQYYLGANNSIQHAAVKYVLDTVIEELMKDSTRKFVYVEQAFFQLWWARQTPDMQSNVRVLVNNGQLEFLNGGWCMHDEANTHYLDMIDQTTLGHQFILQQFGVTPKIGWQIDPFGHSATQAALLSAKVGFEALFFGRIDHQDHDQRMAEKNMEFIWRPSPSLGAEGQVFTGAFQNGNYGPPDGFCFDVNCNDTPIISDDEFIDFNVPNRVDAFLDQINYQAAFTKGNDLMVTMGSDFQYENAREWYENLDRLIAAVNADGRINVFYSTPTAYVAAKNAENNTYSVKTDDFFPYSDDDQSYWTGYFVSRPSLKRYVRSASALLQTARQIDALTSGDGSSVTPLAKAVGVTQHHDAVAGTAKQHVAFDYAQRIHIGQTAAEEMMAQGMANMHIDGHSGSTPPVFEFCELSNITVCAPTVVDSPTSFQVTLWNPLGRSRTELVTVPISNPNIIVMDNLGNIVTAQITTVYNVSSHTAQSAQLALNFLIEVPALGYRTYFIQAATHKSQVFIEKDHLHKGKRGLSSHAKKLAAAANTYVSHLRHARPNGDETLGNSFLTLSFDGATGAVKSYTDVVSGQTTPLGVAYAYYDSYAADGQKSGAYIFRPATQMLPTPIAVSTQLLIQTGPILQEAVQVVNQWINQTFRVVMGQPFVEIEYTVGEIPITDNVGKEVVIQYQTQMATQSKWSADSNAREMLTRVRNYRSSYNLTVTEPIAGNYVPMNAAAFITDGTNQLTVLNDRSQGCVSLEDGVLEIMVHRRTLQDDGRGVGEPINETDWMSPYPDFIRQGRGLVITGKHQLFFGNTSGAASLWRPQLQRVYQPLVEFYSPIAAGSVPSYISTHTVMRSFFGPIDLPNNVDLISFQNWGLWTNTTQFLVRLAHQFAVGEDASLSQPVQVDLSTLFHPTSNLVAIEQMSLTVTSPVGGDNEPLQKMKWRTDEPEENNLDAPASVPLKDAITTLNPMDIQTFLFTFIF